MTFPDEITSERTLPVRKLFAAWKRSADLLVKATMPAYYRTVAERTERTRRAEFEAAYTEMIVTRTMKRTGAPREWAEAWA